MEYVFALLIVAVVIVLTWTWWSARNERDPASSVDTFSRALHAMQPVGVLSGDDEKADAKRPGDDAAEQPTGPERGVATTSDDSAAAAEPADDTSA